jgi:DNA replication and repair protein RecF
VFIQQITVKQFRSFPEKTIAFTSPIVLIEGDNGTGKTSLLEALHYTCYLRSFRTHSPREMIRFQGDAFSVHVQLQTDDDEKHTVHVGFSPKKRKIRVNNKAVASYKELLAAYQAISITEDDVMLIKGDPDGRRMFMDQGVLLSDHTHPALLRSYKKTLEQRNALLQHKHVDRTSYDIWTRQLWQHAQEIIQKRTEFIAKLERKANTLLDENFDQSMSIRLSYENKRHAILDTYESFVETHTNLFHKETEYRRTLFGPHLDDCNMLFQDKRSKQYASRGQQKLILIILKIAQMSLLYAPTLLLVDDFMTDFDEKTSKKLIDMLIQQKDQIIITSPARNELLIRHMTQYSYQTISLN